MSIAATVVVPVAVAVLSLTISLDLAVADFRRTLGQPKALVLGLLSQLTVLPVLALALGLAIRDPALTVAMVLVALAPSGPTSNFLAALGRGDLSLAVLLTVLGTLISVVTFPLLLPILLGWTGMEAQRLSPPTFELLKGLVVMVLLPLGAGMIAARRVPALVSQWRPAAARIASAVFALLVVGAIAAEWRTLAATFLKAAHWVLLLNLGAMAAGALIARSAGLPSAQVTVFALKCAVQNVSIALAVALALMGRPDIAAIAAMYGICQLLTAGAFAAWRRRADRSSPVAASSPA